MSSTQASEVTADQDVRDTIGNATGKHIIDHLESDANLRNNVNDNFSSKSERAKKPMTDQERELLAEVNMTYYCGTCSMGFNDLELFRKHRDEDEEHQYHITRRQPILVPGLGYCGACNCVVQIPRSWIRHSENSDRHNRCVESLRALGVEGDFSKPFGCHTAGVMGDPISHHEIDLKKANSHGYRNNANAAGIPIIGLSHVTQKGQTNEDFHCGVCQVPFRFKGRVSHLSSTEHRRICMEKYHKEFHDMAMKHADRKVRLKFKFAFYASKVEQIEIKEESEEIKAMRQKFFDVEAYLKQEKEQPSLSCKEKAQKWRREFESLTNPLADNIRNPEQYPGRSDPNFRASKYAGPHENRPHDRSYNRYYDGSHDGSYNGSYNMSYDRSNRRLIDSNDFRAPFLEGRRDLEIVSSKRASSSHPSDEQLFRNKTRKRHRGSRDSRIACDPMKASDQRDVDSRKTCDPMKASDQADVDSRIRCDPTKASSQADVIDCSVVHDDNINTDQVKENITTSESAISTTEDDRTAAPGASISIELDASDRN